MHAGGDVVAAGAADVEPADVLDGDARAVAVLARVRARRDVDRLVDVLDDEVLERHVPHVARPRVRLDPRRVRRVDAPDVLVVHVVHQVRLVRVRPHRPDHRAPRLVARRVPDVDVGAVALHREAVLRTGDT